MRRAAALVAASLLLASCVAVTVHRNRPRRGPVKEVGYIEYGGGEVRYSTEGWGWVVASRRKTALKLMSRNCGPDLEPEITDEFPRSDADAAYNGEDISASMSSGDEHFHIERYNHIVYECRPPGSPAPALSTSTAPGSTLVVPDAAASASTATVVDLSSAAAVVPSTGAFAVPPSSAALVSPEPPR